MTLIESWEGIDCPVTGTSPLKLSRWPETISPRRRMCVPEIWSSMAINQWKATIITQPHDYSPSPGQEGYSTLAKWIDPGWYVRTELVIDSVRKYPNDHGLVASERLNVISHGLQRIRDIYTNQIAS